MIDLEAIEKRAEHIPYGYRIDVKALIAEVKRLQDENERLQADNIIMQEAMGGWADGSNWPP